jgi:ribosomal protein S18 acetylase RimI-like enzyme
MNLEYRKVADEEFGTLAKLDKLAFCRDFDFAIQNAEEAKEFLGDCENWLVYLYGITVGYYSVKSIDSQSAEIVGVVVIPEYQKRGIGSAIVGRVLGNFRDIHTVKVVTHPKNIAALKLYSNFGFEIVDYQREYYGKDQPRLIFNRSI